MRFLSNRFAFRALRIAPTVLLALAAFVLSQSATAQQQAAPEANAAAPIQEVVVTGSRIAAPNLTATSPIQVVTQKEIQTSGKTDISDIILQLPQNFDNGLGQDLGNRTSGLTTAGGVATADLRGLGPNRTLVLVDGIRLGIGSPYTFIQQPAPDLDQIPTFLVERVDVVTGGASATYGSDAIAGVINFVMKKNFEGFQVDGQWGANWHDNHDTYWQQQNMAFGNTSVPTGTVTDGRNRNINVIAGANFAEGRGNVTAYFSYYHTDPVSGAKRDWSSCQANEVFDDVSGEVTGQVCGGSINSNYFRPNTGPNAFKEYSVLGTNLVPFGTPGTSPPTAFNSQPYIYMTRDDTRYTAGFMAHENVKDYFAPYIQFYYTDDQTTQNVAPAALFRDSNPNDPAGAGNYYTNCSNPLLSAQEQGILCTPGQIAADAANPGSQLADIRIGRRNIEGGGRISEFEHSSYRMVAGSKGEFLDAWNYDAYGQYYYVSFFNANRKFLSFANIDQALLVTGTKANPVCVNKATNQNCVPYNIWSDGGVTADQLNYLYLTGTGSGSYTMRTLHGEITGELGKYGIQLPTAHDGIAINFGAEHRNEKQVFNPDAAEAGGQLSGFGSAAVPIDAGDDVTDLWAELRVPIVQDKFLAKDLIFDTGYRRSDYSITGAVNTYKFELQWAPITDIRFRGTFQRAIRAPTLIELFNPQLVGLIQFGNDPCAATLNTQGQVVHATATLAQCEAQGVTAAQYGNGSTTNTIPQGASGQLSQLTGGNQHLQAETSDSWTAGLTFTPERAPGLTGSIDYFHIAIDGEVSTIPAAVIMSKCLADSDPTYCSQIVRNPASGSLTGATIAGGGYFIQTNVNIGAALASGVDVQANYKLPLGHVGALVFGLNGSYLQHFESTPLAGEHTYDCAGLFGFTCQTVNPRWRHILRTTWQTPWNFDVAATWRYVGTVANDNNDNDPTLHFAVYGAYTHQPAVIGSYSYIDLAATWHVVDNFELRGGINNVTDKDPPVVPFFIQPGGANAYSAYDQLGRQLFVAFTAKF
jgi:outer membrane receptor protein involved in Fe transport